MHDALAEREGELLDPLLWIVRSRLGRAQLAEVLAGFLRPLSPQELEEWENKVQWVTLRRGEALFRQGAPEFEGDKELKFLPWPIRYSELTPYYEEAKKLLGG